MRRLTLGLLAAGAVLAVWRLADRQSRPDAVSWQAVERGIAVRYPDVRTVSTAALAAWVVDSSRTPPVLLDARQPAEYAVSHLPGARRVDPDAEAEEILAAVEPGRPVVVYCSVGVRSAGVADRLAKAGVADVRNLEGSIFRWAGEGRPVVRDGRRVEGVHPYSAAWGRLLEPRLRADLDAEK